MISKIVLSEEQKKYLIRYHSVPYEYLKKRLELIPRGNSICPWELCTGSRSLGISLSNYVVEQLTARSEAKVKYSDLARIVSPGDKLQGDFTLWIEGQRKKVSEVTMKDYYDEQLNTGDVKEGARYYLQRQTDDTYQAYVIIKP